MNRAKTVKRRQPQLRRGTQRKFTRVDRALGVRREDRLGRVEQLLAAHWSGGKIATSAFLGFHVARLRFLF